MQSYVIITDSSCDLPDETAKALGLTVVPLSVHAGEDTYVNKLDWSEIAPKAFYDRIRGGLVATTAAPSMDAFARAMTAFLEEGKDILYLGFSSGLSGTYNAAAAAARELQDKYPERKIYCVDTLCASLGEGLLVYLAAKKREAGESIEAVRDFAESSKLHICHWFTVDNLIYLKRGGRISAATAILGTILSIKPILHVDNAGHLINVYKVKGRKASIRALADELKKHLTQEEPRTVFISHCDCLEEAQSLEALIRENTSIDTLILNYIGPVIGSHSGPGTIALFFVGDAR